FSCCWLFVPLIFFSISQSKLPGYILPAVPAGAVLLGDFLLQHLKENQPLAKWIVVLHALIAAGTNVPAAPVSFLVIDRPLPSGRPLVFAVGIALVVCIAIFVTLRDASRLRMLRFVTLVPVVLTVAAVLKLGTLTVDQKLSARPLAIELASVETHKLPIA